MNAAPLKQPLRWPIGNAQYRRIRILSSRMLSDFPTVRRTDDTSDVAHSAIIRLNASLQKVQPESELHFWRLVALAIRRTLLDVARQSKPPISLESDFEAEDRHCVDHQANWAEFHERVADLPETERELLELHWYAGLTQQQVAELLGVDIRTIERRWRTAKLSLHRLLYDCVPTSAILNAPRGTDHSA
jgi:RNA polymerase sigma factor (sigma-70 family)